jgi:hypothetical protein
MYIICGVHAKCYAAVLRSNILMNKRHSKSVAVNIEQDTSNAFNRQSRRNIAQSPTHGKLTWSAWCEEEC